MEVPVAGLPTRCYCYHGWSIFTGSERENGGDTGGGDEGLFVAA